VVVLEVVYEFKVKYVGTFDRDFDGLLGVEGIVSL